MKTFTEDLLNLFAIMVIADRRIFASEIEAFLNAMQDLSQRHPDLELPDDGALLRWFDGSKNALRKRLDSGKLSPWFETLIKRLQAKFDLDIVEKELHAIARSDGEIHDAEDALIQLARYEWKLARSNAAI